MTIDDLLAAADTIKNETGVGKNSSTRVGVLFANIINHFGTTIPPETENLINAAVKKYTSGVRKGMTVQFDPELPLPAGFVFSNGNGGVKINGVSIPDWRGRVPVGFDPISPQTPTNAEPTKKNYGKVGNTGGVTGVQLTGKQSGLKNHKHLIDQIESDNSGSSKNALKVENTDHINTSKVYTAESGYEDAEESFDNRMEYGVAYWITKYSDDVDGGGGGGSSTETAPYVLSGLDADITQGQKVSHTPPETHSFTAADISLESTAAPTDFAIEVDVQKNGVSIFTTRPKINAGSLKMTVAPVLVTSPTTFIGKEDIRTVSVEGFGTTETGKNLVLSILMHK